MFFKILGIFPREYHSAALDWDLQIYVLKSSPDAVSNQSCWDVVLVAKLGPTLLRPHGL